MHAIRKILIANRGEIACRVLAACRTHGIASAVVHSEPDADSRHVLEASEAYCIGPAAAQESYLRIDKILDTARACDADAIHPGYGFLSENAEFAAACEDANITFIGPSSASIRALGNKTAARKLVTAAGVPVVPGAQSPIATAEEALAMAREIGFPVLIKAAAGGGGKGMRVVHEEGEFLGLFERAASEALASFNDASVYVEKYLQEPRHIEIQVMADENGNAVYLGERECSIQRRHQKLLEESPSPMMTPALRERMGNAAVAAVQAAGYTNLGTVEFLVDPDLSFYFLEVNTRLQVEHPVTEMCTGLDLVHQQIRIAEGQQLEITQDEVRPRGHSIECRITAEDPFAGFAPSPGKIHLLQEPAGPWVRVDSGVTTGSEVLLHYDPLIAKVITWGADREEAVARMREALQNYAVGGVATTIPFHEKLLVHPQFLDGNLSTAFIEKHMNLSDRPEPHHRDLIRLAAAFVEHGGSRRPAASRSGLTGVRDWKQAGRIAGRRLWL